MVYVSLNLEQLREQDTNFSPKPPFQHQIEAFEKLSNTFKLDSKKPGSGILVLPTGAGKTLTAVRWLCDHVIPKNIKILWFAPSFYLLDQAFSSFEENARGISSSKKTLNIRCVSSNPSHSKASSIKMTDDIVIMTIQTAISNLHPDALDGSGNKVETAFRKFIEDCRETGLFVIVDEAHHSPAYGCRNLLIGEKDTALGLRGLVPGLNLLGLTATPTYTDKARRGWLYKIFENGIIYEAKKDSLILQNILARPNYIEVSTGREMEVDDDLYNKLVKKHQDIPEEIIEKLADDKDRNNFIVQTYVSNKDAYGKTIIFADRWFQCIYIKEKLIKKGIKTDAIYSHIKADPGSAEARNQRTQDDNKRILDDFKSDKLDVLINVRMLTEGADVPNVQTVFITRQTTSSILMTQMIGRALRGEKIGGSSEANVVLFFDNWKRLIDWAEPEVGDTEDSEKKTKPIYPLEYISIRLVEELSKSIESGGDYLIPKFPKIFPTGWYKTEIVYANSDNDNESMEAFTEFVMVYEHTQSKFNKFVEFIVYTNLSDEWSKEYLSNKWMEPQIEKWIDSYFNSENDSLGDKLNSDLIKIVRHIAQNQSAPDFHPFENRKFYDLDKIAAEVINLRAFEKYEYLNQEFSKEERLWKIFYTNLNRFETAVDAVIRSIIHRPKDRDKEPKIITPIVTPPKRELTEEEKEQVKKRDGYACLCCGINKVNKLQIDHIKPFSMSGETSLENSQTLCDICNQYKGTNEIDFRLNTSPLTQPKKLDLSLPYQRRNGKHLNLKAILKTIVNNFYHCQAVFQVKLGIDLTWEIHLYDGNNPKWLLKHKEEILEFIQNELDYIHVQDIKVY